MDSRFDNLRAWALCAPATAAMLAFNILPACRALIDDPPRPLMAELSSWAIASTVIALGAVRVCGAILLVELPLAFLVAVLLLHKRRARSTAPAVVAVAVFAALGWRLLFGGRLGFATGGDPLWWSAVFEAWRTLPLTAVLLYSRLLPAGRALGEAARLDGAGAIETACRIYLPLCRPAMWAVAAIHTIDYLRAVQAPLISLAAAERATWTLLVLIVATLTLRFAERTRAD